jgi:hypothetical protein
VPARNSIVSTRMAAGRATHISVSHFAQTAWRDRGLACRSACARSDRRLRAIGCVA